MTALYQIAGERGRAEELAATFAEDDVRHRLRNSHFASIEPDSEIVARLESLMAQSNPALTTARHSLTTSLKSAKSHRLGISRDPVFAGREAERELNRHSSLDMPTM